VNKLAVIVLLLIGLSACRGKKPEEGREPVQTAGPGAVVGSAAPGAPVPATGGAATGSAASAAMGSAAAGGGASSSGVGCAMAVTLTCEADQRDGCADGLTSVHVCVAKDAKAGPPCAQEIALACPTGQVDACLHNPPQATNHVCVSAPKPTP
jgi:hypothetical protein